MFIILQIEQGGLLYYKIEEGCLLYNKLNKDVYYVTNCSKMFII